MRRLRVYLTAVGALLLVQGSISLVLHEGFGVDLAPTHGLLTMHDPHAVLHVVWGIVILLAVRAYPIALGAAFGVFYTTLGIVGLFDHDAFGMDLGAGQNAFHLIIGPLALVFTALALRAP